ncbi:MAG: polymer-forming cytoskeletal protein [Bacteroidales bacterium]|nr:polymer-forming cytoskeletal protein [Bacteroidales bacterium]
MAKNITPEPSVNKLVQGTVVKGNITANGDFRLDGVLVGSITSKGRIVVGSTGEIEGEVTCQNADISGKVSARIAVAELLSLKSTAIFKGEISTSKLAIEPGAKFSGSCNMDEGGNKNPVSPQKNEEFKQKEKIIG